MQTRVLPIKSKGTCFCTNFSGISSVITIKLERNKIKVSRDFLFHYQVTVLILTLHRSLFKVVSGEYFSLKMTFGDPFRGKNDI